MFCSLFFPPYSSSSYSSARLSLSTFLFLYALEVYLVFFTLVDEIPCLTSIIVCDISSQQTSASSSSGLWHDFAFLPADAPSWLISWDNRYLFTGTIRSFPWFRRHVTTAAVMHCLRSGCLSHIWTSVNHDDILNWFESTTKCVWKKWECCSVFSVLETIRRNLILKKDKLKIAYGSQNFLNGKFVQITGQIEWSENLLLILRSTNNSSC